MQCLMYNETRLGIGLNMTFLTISLFTIISIYAFLVKVTLWRTKCLNYGNNELNIIESV